MPRARPSHCKHGHPFTPSNTYTRPDTKCRQCRTCHRERSRLWRARNLAKVREAARRSYARTKEWGHPARCCDCGYINSPDAPNHYRCFNCGQEWVDLS